MPNPFFEPIIGRDFSDIGAQRYAWAGFNANIEAQNLARAAAAEEAQNRWALTSAQMAREDAARQAAIDANARNTALNLALSREQMALGRRSELEQAAIQQKQFEDTLKLQREQIAAGSGLIDKRLKLTEEEQKQRIDFNGERYAAAYGIAKTRKTAADAALEAVQADFDKAEADLAALNAKTKRSEEEIARQLALSTSLPKLKANLRLATTAANRSNADFERIRGRLWAGDYEIDDESGKISHPQGSREWSFEKAVSEAGGGAPKPLTPPTTTPAESPTGSNWFKSGARSIYGLGQRIGNIVQSPFSRQPAAPEAAPVAEAAPEVPLEVNPPVLDRAMAQSILNRTKGDKELARKMARDMGYTWPTY